MKKAVLILFLMFLVLGILAHTPMLSGDDDNRSGSDNETDSDSITDDSESSDDDDDENETEIEEEDEEEENEIKVCCMVTKADKEVGSRTAYKLIRKGECVLSDWDQRNNVTAREIVKESFCRETRKDSEETKIEIRKEGNCTIIVQKKMVVEGGKRVELFKKRVECTDGTKKDIEIKVENRTESGRFRERIKYEFHGEEINVEAGEGVDLQEESNATHYEIKARLENGTITKIKIMPDVASDIALERLRALNFTVELKKSVHKNIPRVVYNIETNKNGRFLGVFKFAMKVDGEVDPETGEFIGVSKPWWAFLVSGEDSDQTGDDDDEAEDNETDENETQTNEINGTFLENTTSNESDIAA